MPRTQLALHYFLTASRSLHHCTIDHHMPSPILHPQEGLTRFCTEKYSKPKAENLSVAYMHLTNYAVRGVIGSAGLRAHPSDP